MSATIPSEGSSAASVLNVAIIGGGIAGICMGIALRRRGIGDFRIFEKSQAFGGTWHDNVYPGAACDVPSLLYSYSFAPNPAWSRRFSAQPEIFQYLQDCVRRFGLEAHGSVGTGVRSVTWIESLGRWELALDDGTLLQARTVVSAVGQLSRPRYPDIAGRERFTGEAFHSARWNEHCDLSGKRVAIIGSAASAVQIVPEVAREAAQLTVYQRSPNYILKRGDRPYREWEKWLFRHFPLVQKVRRLGQYLFGELLLFPALRRRDSVMARLLVRRCDRFRAAQVADPDLRRQLTPDYPFGCKRVLFSDDYYPALCRQNVDLVTSPIREITAGGLISEDGRERSADVIIHATGFAATELLSTLEVRGCAGQTLEDRWSDGAEAYKGICVDGFPNFFLLYGPHTNLGSNSIIYMIERQTAYVVDCIDKILVHKLRALEICSTALREDLRRIQQDLSRTVWATDCSSWYRDDSGKIINNWPYSATAYGLRTRAPDFSEFEMRA